MKEQVIDYDPITGRKIIRRPWRQKKKNRAELPQNENGGATFEGPPQVFGYVRVSTKSQDKSPLDQRTMIQDLAAKNGLTVDAFFQDAPVQNPDGSWNDAQSGKIPISDRPAGGELCRRLRPGAGDVIITSAMDRLFRKLSDSVIMLDRWERAGVRMLVGDFPMFTNLNDPFQKAMQQMMSVFAELNRKLIVNRTKEALACRKREKRAVCQYAGYGFQLVPGPINPKTGRRTKVRAADPQERQIMGQIVQWRIAGSTWEQIYFHLSKLGIKTRRGTEWSIFRIYRAFDAELKLQLTEHHRQTTPTPTSTEKP